MILIIAGGRDYQIPDEGYQWAPDGALAAFPGGTGTADVTKRARAAGLRVFEYKS